MTDVDRTALLCSLGGFICLIIGVYGLLNKENIKKSYYFMSKNMLVVAATMIPFFIFVLFFRFTMIGKNIMTQSVYNVIALIWIAGSSLIVGLYGYLKRGQIKNDIYTQISKLQLFTAIGMTVFIFFYWHRWHHF